MKHISYPKIEQYRNIVASVKRNSEFEGLDENGDAIYNKTLPKPILQFKGTVKLHGTNASICYNSKDGLWIQSRQNIITVEKDNAGFAFFVESNKNEFMSLINKVIKEHKIDADLFTISIYGEWAGKGIQKSVGISQLDKAFYIFGLKISKPQDEEFNAYWLDSSNLRCKESKIYNVEDYQTYSIEVDFNQPELCQNKFVKITEQVEKECPISKAFGINNGLGEGVVWSTTYKGNIHRFKVKGQKHSVSKVKKLASVDVEKIESINKFVEYAVTENRFNQACQEIYKDDILDIKKLGDLIRWVISDINKEELDVLNKNNLEPKGIGRYVSNKVREMFFKQQKI